MGVTLELAEEHAVIATEANLALARRHDDVKNCVDLERLRLQHLTHRVHFDDVNVAEVLPEDEELFLDSEVLVLKELDVVDPLLQLLVVFLLEGIHVEDEEVTVVAADPGEVVVHTAAEKPVP